MSIDRRQLGFLMLVALAGVGATLLMFWLTAVGPAVQPDSIIYMGTAQSILGGDGFLFGGQPMTHFPPGYPLLLALVGLFQDGDVLQAGRWLSALLYGANLSLLGLAVFLSTERSWSATGCAICIFLVSAPIMSDLSYVLSEAPFIMFSLAALILLSLHAARPSLGLTLAASVFVGCAIATRYIGVTLLVPLVCGLLKSGQRPLKRKIGDTFIATAVALLPLVSWLVRNSVVAGTATNRELVVHFFGLQHAEQLLKTLYDFFLPTTYISGWVKTLQLGVAAALFLAALVLLYRKNYIKRYANSVRVVLPTLCVVFFLTYIAFLVISVSFLDAHTPLDFRILLPAFLAILMAAIALVWSLSSALHNRILWYGFILFVFFVVSSNSVGAVARAVEIHRNGNGFTSRQWQDSQTIASVRSLASDRHIYSNGNDVITFLTAKAATQLPRVIDPHTRQPNQDFDEQLQVVCREVAEGEAIVVYLDGITWRWYMPTKQELGEKCSLPTLDSLADGVIYGR